MSVVPVLAAAFILGFAAAAFALAAAERRRRAVLPRRLARIRQMRLGDGEGPVESSPAPGGDPGAGQSGAGRARRPGRLLHALDARLRRRGRYRSAEARLKRAGLRLRLAEYLALRGILAGAAGLAGLALGGLVGGLGAVAGGLLLPELMVEAMGKRRMRMVARQLPDALSVIANSLRSGFSFLQALGVAAEEMPEPIAAELRQVVRETQVDISVEDALANLLNRMPLADLQLVVTAVLLQRQVGGNLAGLLDTVGEMVRLRWRIEADIRSLTAQGRLSGWIVGCLPLALGGFVLAVNPGYVGILFTEPLGKVMVGTALGLQLVGALVIRRLIRVEV